MLDLTAFEIADGPHAHTRMTGKLLLRQATIAAQARQQLPEIRATASLFGHIMAHVATFLP
jgi:hypothetical protein